MERQLLISLIFIFALSSCQTTPIPTPTIEQKIEITEKSIETEIQYTSIWDYIVKNSDTYKETYLDDVTLKFINKHLKNKDSFNQYLSNSYFFIYYVVQELEAANLQDAARIAARRHDWNEVNDLVAQLDVLGVENEWVKESTKKLREYADRRETERFSKEAFYKSDRMRTRMGVRDESARYIPEAEAMEVPSFLRRKVEFGKKSQSDRRNS